MKIEVEKLDTRKGVKAVLGDGGNGIFLRKGPFVVVYLDITGNCEIIGMSLEAAASKEGRTPLYEGDTITITF